MKKLIKLITLASALALGRSAFAANGDIYEIRPCDPATYETIGPVASIDAPLTSGERVAFKIRLVNQNQGTTYYPWGLAHYGANTPEVDLALNPLQIGIYVSGELRYATLVGTDSTKYQQYTEFYFEYVTKPGDFALPIKLATAAGPAGEVGKDGLEYLCLNLRTAGTGIWGIENELGSSAHLWFGDGNGSPAMPLPPVEPDKRMYDYSLSQAGFFVKTVDFDDNWEEAETLWRSVHQDSSITVGVSPSLVATAAPDQAVTLHVWSMNEGAVRIKGGRSVDLWLDDTGTSKVTTQVGDVTIAGGQVSANFSIEGVAEGESANLVLSAWDNYNYNASAKRIVDYVTVPVRCIEPLPPSVIVECDKVRTFASGDYLVSAARLNVYLSQPYADADVEVTVTPSFSDGLDAANWGDYVRFSTVADEVTTLPSAEALPKVTLPKNTSGRLMGQPIWVYALKADEHTTEPTGQLVFTPSIDSDPAADAAIGVKTPCGLYVSAQVPGLLTPKAEDLVEAICGDNTPFTVTVSDTFANMNDREEGYEIWIKYRATDVYKQLEGRFGVGKGGVLYRLDGKGGLSAELPYLSYPSSGDVVSSVYVVSPISHVSSDVVTFSAHVAEARTTEVTTLDEKGEMYNEGDTVNFSIKLSEKNDTGDALYAFLLVSGTDDLTMFKGLPKNFIIADANAALPTSAGLVINRNNDTATGKIMVLDGEAADLGGRSLGFEVVLCTSANYDPAKRVAGYDSNVLSVSVLNVEPVIERIEVNTMPAKDGEVFASQFPKGMIQNFRAKVSDVTYDLANGFKYKWTALREGAAVESHEIEGDPWNPGWTYNFPRAGHWTMELQVMDKDMGDWSKQVYAAEFDILDSPTIFVTSDVETLYESSLASRLHVRLSYFDSDTPMKVKLTVSEYSPGTNPGLLELDHNLRDPEGAANEYFVELDNTIDLDLGIDAMDGTMRSATHGFLVKAEVISEEINPKSGTPWKDYYLPGTLRVYVENATPTCTVTQEENTNAWKSAGGIAKNRPLGWSVRNDAEADFTGIADFPGIRVRLTDAAGEHDVWVTEPSSGVFYPDLGTTEGLVDVTLSIEDKDGAYMSWVYQFEVEPSKFLSTTATGPAGGKATSALSQKYVNAKGLGEGHVWVRDATFSKASAFELEWNCGKNDTQNVYGWGYKVGAVDNGLLDNRSDIAIDVSGAAESGVAVTTPYEYGDAEKDSYLYTWLLHTAGETGGMTSEILGSIAPERAEGAAAAGIVSLPKEKKEEGGYVKTFVEAIFAKEWRAADNCGDINQDGIPDRALVRYGLGIYDVDGGTMGGNDLADVSAFNDDEDYLPAPSTKGNRLVPNVKSEWQTQGEAFHAFYEIRGFGPGLNARYPNQDGTLPPRDFTVYEEAAFQEWATEHGVDAGDAEALDNYWAAGADGWTPENPTDPTEEDTDKDGLPDGYEYWFWYGAKVGYPDSEGGAWQGRMKGRRLNLNDIEVWDEIASDDICEAFNPTVSGAADGNAATRGNLLKRDFDNDGLYDYEEFLIGTSPVDCDTDDDGLPDGWEVVWNLNPLDDEEETNADGDFYARAPITAWVVTVQSGDGTQVYLSAEEVAEDATSFTGALLGDALATRTLNGDLIPATRKLARTLVKGATITQVEKTDLVLVHDQVYSFFGYDPRTGWGMNDLGFLDARYEKDGIEWGMAVNTAKFDARAEYAVYKYLEGVGAEGETALEKIVSLSTCPSLPFDGVTYGDSATAYASEIHGADTDGDGMPDGWELYVGLNPVDGEDAKLDPDEDGLLNVEEFACSHSENFYLDCDTIIQNHPGANYGWWNKWMPTDPSNPDTDGDSVLDGPGATDPGEMTFVYGSIEDDHVSFFIRGGGLNPCTVDTDLDGLPDGWEKQFAGKLVEGEAVAVAQNDQAEAAEGGDGEAAPAVTAAPAWIEGGMDGTFQDAYTTFAEDPVTGTVRDLDYDHDGLENFQEYLTQAVRCWRYDDAETPLMGRALVWAGGVASFSAPVKGGYVPMDVLNGEKFLATLKESPIWEAISAGNDYLAYVEAEGGFDYASIGYFAPCPHEWDAWHLLGVNHDPKLTYAGPGYRLMLPPKRMISFDGAPVRKAANGYVSTDPTKWDSDGDGMDDYWEIFHGLNPLLGIDDLIAQAYDPLKYGYALSEFAMAGAQIYDPFLAPWTLGMPEADPDGDGLRNSDEAITGNMTSPATYHTDPTPLWMTDQTSPMSYVSQYYNFIQGPEDTLPVLINGTTYVQGEFHLYPWGWFVEDAFGSVEGINLEWRYAFEEVEGYDTDGDWRGDAHEVVKSVNDRSDPLNADDPDRRAALYLDGQPGSVAYSYRPTWFGSADTFDAFRQFTVECWVKPDSIGAEQTIIERGSSYPGSNINKPMPQWRANFRLAINPEGHVYGLFDNSDAVASGSVETFTTQTVIGPELEAGEWAHVALTFDGKYLKLFVNGSERKSEKTNLIPANGVISVSQEPSEIGSYPMADYVVAASALTIGARRAEVFFDWSGLVPAEMLWRDQFAGYVSEVRIWDGARAPDDIARNYRTRFGSAELIANRDEVYAEWRNAATRNDNDGNPMLPAQLAMHYDFSELPSATEAKDVALTPSGFTAAVIEGCKIEGVTPEEANVGWWYETPLHSSVYTDYHVIPWIQNSVARQPLIDGSMHDSMYWSEILAGATLAAQNRVATYGIPNGGNPYAGRNFLGEDARHVTRWRLLGGGSPDAFENALKYQFKLRSEFIGRSDLVPLGGAYSRRVADYWDGMGASSVWSDTALDSDGDDLPDWWEDYAAKEYGVTGDLTPSTVVTYHGKEMTAAEAYVRDLAHGLLPTGEIDPAFVNREDKNADGVPDWWSGVYGLETAGDDDEDMDGLSNYVEYLLSEVFDLGQLFSPVDAHSISEYDSDYFFKIGQLYAGEIFTDHDMMEDSWEKLYAPGFVSRYLWDAASDNEEDGWSAFAEARYNTFTTSIVADERTHMLESAEMRDFPTPTLKVTVRYNGAQPLAGGAGETTATTSSNAGDDLEVADSNALAPLVVRTYTRSGDVVPDAVFNVNPGAELARDVYLGAWGDRIVRGNLTPGYILGDSLAMQVAPLNQNDTYCWSLLDDEGQVVGTQVTDYETYVKYYRMYGPARVELTYSPFEWEDFLDGNAITVTRDGETSQGYICYNGVRAGEIDLTTGAFSFDLGAFKNWGMTGTNGTFALESAVYRFQYTSKMPVLQQNKMELYLGIANLGYVREGANTVEAFYDLNGDGEFTPGEPYGVVRGVDVGWYQGQVEIELTDTSALLSRVDVTTGAFDRGELYGTESGDYTNLVAGTLSGGQYERVRVARTLISGVTAEGVSLSGVGIGDYGITNRIVLDKWIEIGQRNYITEMDVLQNELDLDWDYLYDEVIDNPSVLADRLDVTEVAYRIIIGNGSASLADTNNLLQIATVRHFDLEENRAIPKTAAPGGQTAAVYGARPVFKWTMNGLNSYTAFDLQIRQNGETVWDSGIRRAPATDLNGVYTFVPDVYAGDLLDPAANYTWRVTMLNSKFRTAAWSDEPTFRMNTLTNSFDYGSIKVCAKYFGPESVLTAGAVRIEAFETPDFTGDPVARTVVDPSVKETVSAFDEKHELNATLIGLPKGTYYVRAYVDMKKFGTKYQKDEFESWGYVSPRDGTSQAMFSPTAIEVGERAGAAETFTCYIEDVDRNGNCLPDAWEMVKNDGKLDRGTERIDDTLASGIAINKEISGNLQNLEGDGSMASGLAAYALSVVKNAGVAALALGIDPTGYASYSEAASAGAGQAKVVADDVEISAIDKTDGTLMISADFDARTVISGKTGSAFASLYVASGETPTEGQAICAVLVKYDLADAEWTELLRLPVTVRADGTIAKPIDLTGKLPAGLRKCFFRLKVINP